MSGLASEQMAPVNVVWIAANYQVALATLKKSARGATTAISAMISSFLAGLDGNLIGAVVKWVIDKVIDALCDFEAKALSIVLRCEYMWRCGNVNYENAKKAYKLANKCSHCKCIGHNKQNHTDNFTRFLMAERLKDFATDATSLVPAVEEDGWWEWLIQ